MSNRARAAPRLNDDQVSELLGLLSNADSAELKTRRRAMERWAVTSTTM